MPIPSQLEPLMKIAIEEARQSLREGNHGFGVVVVKDGAVLAQAHDREESDQDPTSHAEINAIRMACSQVGKDLSGTILVSTHEPCPMCAGAIIWARIPHIVYGYGIADAIHQERDRIEIPVEEFYHRVKAAVRVEKGVLQSECSILYNRAVRQEVKKLQGATDEQLREDDQTLAAKRIAWYREEGSSLALGGENALERAYRLLLWKLGISREEAPIAQREEGRIVFHSRNFCPTLEACIILGLDTRRVCRLCNEGATDQLVRQIDPGLRFSRNYEKIRPHSEHCEERIEYEPGRSTHHLARNSPLPS